VKYDLVGQDGNVFSLIGYTRNAMRSEKFTAEEIAEVQKKAMSSDYNNAVCVLDEAIQLCNKRASE
jgi:hypothetical protein